MSFESEYKTEIIGEFKKADPLERAKQKLRDEQETIYEKPDQQYVDIEIKSTGTVGEDCVVKVSKKVPFIQLVISQDVQWKKRDKYDQDSKPELVCKGFIIEEAKNTDTIKTKWADIEIIAGKERNLLKEGEYMVEARAWSINAYEETTARRLVQVKKND